MSKIHTLVRVCTRMVVALSLVTAVATRVPSSAENETATELASAPDTGAVSSFSGYMVAVG